MNRNYVRTAADVGVLALVALYGVNLLLLAGVLAPVGLRDAFLTPVEQFVLLLAAAFLFSTAILLRDERSGSTTAR